MIITFDDAVEALGIENIQPDFIHENDSNNSSRIGKQCEVIFEKIAQVKNFKTVKATFDENTKGHFDYTLIKNNQFKKIDVKGFKHKNRWDDKRDENIFYVEKSSSNGEDGWTYGKADFFAFARKTEFCIVPAKKVREVISQRFKSDLKHPSASHKVSGTWYYRTNEKKKKEQFGFLYFNDIEPYIVKRWQYSILQNENLRNYNGKNRYGNFEQ